MMDPVELVVNTISEGVYSIPENYEIISADIAENGILEPIIVDGKYRVISGNIRLKIALDRGIKKVPVIIEEGKTADEKSIIVSHNQQRIKKYEEVLNEYEILEARYHVGQGSRTDLDESKARNKELLRMAINASNTKMYKIKSIGKAIKNLYGEKPEIAKKIWEEINSGTKSIHCTYNLLKTKMEKKENDGVVPKRYEFIVDGIKIYNKLNRDLAEILSESIQTIVVSPSYFRMKDNGTGEDQRGLEKDIESYLENLIQDFKDCSRVLKKDGSLWVILNEGVFNGQYNAIPHRFIIKLMAAGWRFTDEIIWIKDNPVPIPQSKKFSRSHEYIFHLTKNEDYYFDFSWSKELEDVKNKFSTGTEGNAPAFKSTFKSYHNILESSCSNIEWLRRKCKELKGFNLTHSSTFPLFVPLMCVLATSKSGDTVLDICSGTGTTGEAAVSTKRDYVGYEINPQYNMAAAVRLLPYTKKNDLETQL